MKFFLYGQLIMKQDQHFEGDLRIEMKSLLPAMYVMRYQDKLLTKSIVFIKE